VIKISLRNRFIS